MFRILPLIPIPFGEIIAYHRISYFICASRLQRRESPPWGNQFRYLTKRAETSRALRKSPFRGGIRILHGINRSKSIKLFICYDAHESETIRFDELTGNDRVLRRKSLLCSKMVIKGSIQSGTSRREGIESQIQTVDVKNSN